MDAPQDHVLVIFEKSHDYDPRGPIKSIFGPMTQRAAEQLAEVLSALAEVDCEARPIAPAPLMLTNAGHRLTRS